MRRGTQVQPSLVLAAILSCSCATAVPRPQTALDESCAGLAGSWEGTLSVRGDESKSVAGGNDLRLRLVFAGPQARVFLVEGGSWMEAKSGSFAARCLGPSAIVHAIDSDRDLDGTWVESWVIAVTARSRDEVLARWVRMVNNLDLPLENRSSKFSFDGLGTLRRVSTP